jgi:hypothetical protein
MFEPPSRYYALETVRFVRVDGQELAYKRRRLLPPPESLQTLVEVTVQQGDRLDLITARVLGDPEQFWRVCDANLALDPLELTAMPGRRVRVPLPLQ